VVVELDAGTFDAVQGAGVGHPASAMLIRVSSRAMSWWCRSASVIQPRCSASRASAGTVASGVIEGTCRYLVADRMDITGARGGVNGAEAVLKLRAVRANDDFDEYWKFHLNRLAG